MDAKPTLISEEQFAYAYWLERAVWLAFTALIAGLGAYLSGALALAIPLERMPALWGLPAAEFLARSGVQRGWGWLELGAGEVAVLGSIAYLQFVSTLCLFRLPPIYARQRQWWYLAFALLEIGVLVLAASGLLDVR